MRSVLLCLLIFFLFSCSNEEYTYYKLNNKVLTRIDNQNTLETFILMDSVDRFDKKRFNGFYVKDKPMLNGFQGLLYENSDSVVLLQPYGDFKIIGKPQNMYIKRMKDSSFAKIFFDDALSRNYIRVENK